MRHPVTMTTHPARRIAATLLVATVSLLAGCSSLPSTTTTDARPSVVALLTKKSNDWDAAIVRKDRAAIAANMADDFRQIDGAGSVSDKPEFVDELVAPSLTINPYTVEDFNIRLYGDVALLSGHSTLTGQEEGKRFVSHYRYIDIYVRRGGEWKIVSVQISKFPR